MSDAFRLNRRGRRALSRRRGMSLVEVALSLTLTGLALAGLMQMSTEANDQINDAAAGDRLQQVYAAAQDYLRVNNALLAANVPVGGATLSIPVGRTAAGLPIPGPVAGGLLPSLQGGGFLPSGYVDRNSYRQHHLILVRQITAGQIDMMVETVGPVMKPGDVGRMATKIGASGGIVSGTLITGVGGGYSEPTASWPAGADTPSSGHAVAVLYYNQATALADFLYRDNIGIPEANRMHTNIDVNGNGLDNTATITGKTGRLAVTADTAISGSLGTNGLDGTVGMPGSMPNGIHTTSVYGEDTIGAGNAGALRAYLNSGGAGYVENSWTVGAAGGTSGLLDVNGASNVTGDSTVGGDLTVGYGTGSGSVGVAGNISAGGGISAVNDIYAGRNIGAAGSAFIGNNLVLQAPGSQIQWGAYGSYLEANGTTLGLYGANFYTPNSMIADVSVQAGSNMASPVYYGKTGGAYDTSYYLVPNGSSRLGGVDADTLASRGTLAVAGNSTFAGTTLTGGPASFVGNDGTAPTTTTGGPVYHGIAMSVLGKIRRGRRQPGQRRPVRRRRPAGHQRLHAAWAAPSPRRWTFRPVLPATPVYSRTAASTAASPGDPRDPPGATERSG